LRRKASLQERPDQVENNDADIRGKVDEGVRNQAGGFEVAKEVGYIKRVALDLR